jgi:hypothetical protein
LPRRRVGCDRSQPVGADRFFLDVVVGRFGSREAQLSYRTIAAALALEDVSIGERLVAFSLASYADAEHQTFVGNRSAATRAGLSHSQYLAAREQLIARGLVSVAVDGGGRGRSSTLTLNFARRGPWREERINPQLFEAALSYSRARGPARVLLATLAALANDERDVLALTTDEIRAAAGLSDRTYRRARASLLASGEVVVESCTGGRGNTSRWRLADPSILGAPLLARRRVAPARNARPLLSAAAPAVAELKNPGQDRTVSGVNPGQDRTLSELNPGQDRTVSSVNPGQNRTLSAVNPGQNRTVSPETPAETPAKTPAETPAPNARAGKEPGNQKNNYPPSPPKGGSASTSITVIEEHITERGRKRKRPVTVDLIEIRARLADPSRRDQADWGAIRTELARRLSLDQFEVWLAPLALIAVDAGVLLLGYPAAARSWMEDRFGPLLQRTADRVGRELRVASEAEVRAVSLPHAATPPADSQRTLPPSPTSQIPYDQQEAS